MSIVLTLLLNEVFEICGRCLAPGHQPAVNDRVTFAVVIVPEFQNGHGVQAGLGGQLAHAARFSEKCGDACNVANQAHVVFLSGYHGSYP